MSPTRFSSYDAVVVGARCAGAATALLLARRGLRVLVIDQGRYGTDTVSTHALMRAGVLQLHRWGVLDDIKAAGTPTVRSTSFHYADDVVDVQIKPHNGVDGLYAPRRTVIDKVLVDAARASGAEISFETPLLDVRRSADGRVCGIRAGTTGGSDVEITANVVIGADGVRSAVARLVGAGECRSGRHATGVVFTYWLDTGIEGYHWYYRPGVSAGAIPTNHGLTCVFVSVTQDRFHREFRQGSDDGYRRLLLECAPDLAAVVARSQQGEKFHGFAGHPGYFRQSCGPGWALVGDAGYFKDPLTAHGITDALIDAEVLARAVAAQRDDVLMDYQRARDERAAGLFDVTDAVASFEWDLPGVQELHRALSEEMKRETRLVSQFDETGDPGIPPDARPDRARHPPRQE